jgi:hypothetical protein
MCRAVNRALQLRIRRCVLPERQPSVTGADTCWNIFFSPLAGLSKVESTEAVCVKFLQPYIYILMKGKVVLRLNT